MKHSVVGFSDTTNEPMRLGAFIRDSLEQIIDEWTSFADSRIPASEGMTALALRDHVEEILDFLARDLESSQSSFEQLQKSQGDGPKEGGANWSAAEVHADLRLNDGFDIDQMVSEYRALRACVVKLWSKNIKCLDRSSFDDLIRFNEAIDQAVTESISHYTRTLERSRNMFLGILGHDLRNPLGAVSASANRITKLGTLNDQQSALADQITEHSSRALGVLDDLLDLTRVQFGSELPLSRASMDMALLGRQLVDEMRAAYPDRAITFETAGDMVVEWDMIRMGQVLSNLIGNALAHGSKDTPVHVSVHGSRLNVVLSVQNQGVPIPADKIRAIFDPLIRGDGSRKEPPGSTHLGLGLYITKKIVGSHGGTVDVKSDEKGGTKFNVSLPRHPTAFASRALNRRPSGSW